MPPVDADRPDDAARDGGRGGAADHRRPRPQGDRHPAGNDRRRPAASNTPTPCAIFSRSIWTSRSGFRWMNRKRFDNSGDALSISPLLLEKYFTVRARIASIPDRGDRSGAAHLVQRPAQCARPLACVEPRHDVPLHGACTFTTWMVPFSCVLWCVVPAGRSGTGSNGPLLDGRRLETFDVPDGLDVTQVIEVEHELAAGSHVLGVSFVNDHKPARSDPARSRRPGTNRTRGSAGPGVPLTGAGSSDRSVRDPARSCHVEVDGSRTRRASLASTGR